jgi:glucosamine--fructose-6-phosphate aminotransferase (isomerizing)
MLVLSLFTAIWSDNLDIQNRLVQLPDILRNRVLTQEKISSILLEAKRYSDMKTCFILGRGLLYPIALETALKMQETSYIHAHGYAISDFWHGPLAMIRKGTRVILYGCADVTLSDEIKIAKKLFDLGAEIIVISDTEELNAYAAGSIILPKVGHTESSFLYAVTAQLFAYGISISNGLNPDDPRNLRKVTITR